MKLWGGRFKKEQKSSVDRFTSSLELDKRLALYDIKGSLAHSAMLAAKKIISSGDRVKIAAALKKIEKEILSGRFVYDDRYEDIHMSIERRLTELAGEAGKRLHTARSRNDQVLVDVKLFLKDESAAVIGLLSGLQSALIKKARENDGVIVPGYTHMQRAQAVLLPHYFMAYFFMLKRDIERFADAAKRADSLPLGACALAGTGIDIDRAMTAKLLGFASVSENSIDTVSDRDFMAEFLSAAAIAMVHLSRLSEDLIIWNTSEFNFIELDDAYTTGSSIMPQKKNPDILELVRGRSSKSIACLTGILTLLKGLPLSYNRDLQDDKYFLFESLDNLKRCADIMTELLANLKINRKAIADSLKKGNLSATDVAEYLVKKGLPFREAHEITGRIVLYAVENNIDISDLKLAVLKRFSGKFGPDAPAYIKLEQTPYNKVSAGGTSKKEIARQLREAEVFIVKTEKYLEARKK